MCALFRLLRNELKLCDKRQCDTITHIALAMYSAQQRWMNYECPCHAGQIKVERGAPTKIFNASTKNDSIFSLQFFFFLCSLHFPFPLSVTVRLPVHPTTRTQRDCIKRYER